LKKGQLFFALWGQNFNGNEYASEALDKGASYAVIDDPVYETDRTILVDDCLMELHGLAQYYRKMIKVPVLAITGTNGKTTTKELIAAIMSKKLRIHYTKGNFNNEIGLPLTILSAPPNVEMMILEMGANHMGEIRTLCNVARPDYGIITNIGAAHIEGFGSYEGVLKAKTELYEHLRKVNGIAIYDDKNPYLTIITRAGEGTKMVFTGDIEQIDSPYLDTASNGLSYLSDKMKDQDVFAHVNLVKGERSPLAELASKLL